MRAEIISVGTELLLGDILNTNARYLAQQLAALGFGVYYQTTVGDNPRRLRGVVRRARRRSDVLLLTGGLGPTDDDLTKQTLAAAFGDRLVLDEAELERIRTYFEQRGQEMPAANARQAMLPRRGAALPNPNGTAPGVVLRRGGKTAFLLPGPPSEMRPMFEDYVRPTLEAMQDGVIHSLVLHTVGAGESALQQQLGGLLAGDNPTAALYAKAGEVHIRVTARAATLELAQDMCQQLAGRIRAELGQLIYAENGDDLETTVVKLLAARGQSVATAESCSGGLLSGRISSVPGASAVFGFGLCSYANEIKHEVLGVSDDTLAKHGAVSAETAAEMAQNAARLGGAFYGVGITGIAGPDGGTPQKPVGLVYVAVCGGGRMFVRRLQLGGRGRQHVRYMATQHALDMLRRMAAGFDMPPQEQVQL